MVFAPPFRPRTGSRKRGAFLVVLALAAWCGAGVARAEEPAEGTSPTAEASEKARPPEADVWVFTNGELVRRVDVSSFPAEVRAAVVARLAALGFRRVDEGGTDDDDEDRDDDDPAAAAAESERRRLARRAELRREIEELVRHGGRHPALEGSARGTAPRGALGPVPFLGARGRLEPGTGGDACLRLEEVPAGSLAAAAGLVPGDRILALDGRAPRPAALLPWARSEALSGQRTLIVRRTVGRIEHWEIRVPPAKVEKARARTSGSRER